jgi:Putative  PD-(D/E)XK family member, (DUF4420)
MVAVTPESWRPLPSRSGTHSELAAEAISDLSGAFLAIDHDGTHHLLLAVDGDVEPINDERSRGIRAVTRPLSVQGQRERHFIDVLCAAGIGQDVFNLVVTAILEHMQQSDNAPEAVLSTLARWRRFWNPSPESGLTGEEVRGLFGELWFLALWLLPHGHGQIGHWLGPTGTRHDFQWPALAIEAKATTSVRGHIHRINGLDQLETPAGCRLWLFSLRMREETTASNSIVTLIESITSKLEGDSEALDIFETRLTQTGYSAAEIERYSELRFRVINERLYEVVENFPRISDASFADGLPEGIERVEYEINLDACPRAMIADSPSGFEEPH